jgi:hypothetical protein
MKSTRIILVLAVLFAASLCIAGSSWDYKCENPKCAFQGGFGMGGGFVFQMVTGYCNSCRKFVSISWKAEGVTGEMKKFQDEATGLLKTAPQRVGTVWNPATGLTADLYPCPHCKKPFMGFDGILFTRGGRLSAPGNIVCPICTNLTLKFEYRGEYD